VAQQNGWLNEGIVRCVVDAAADHPVVVALGGGSDSGVLLAAVVEGLGTNVVRAVFVQHGLPSSSILEKAAAELAADLGVEFTVLEAPVDDGADLEARTRAARYGAIEGALVDGELAMTAHTIDDQAETVLMRLARGSGSEGLAGIPVARDVWRRPLLGFTKVELRAEATARELAYADDPANQDERFTRSRIRHEIMPVLEHELPGSVRDGFARSASLLGSDERYIAAVAAAIPLRTNREGVRIAAAPLATADAVVASRAARSALRLVLDGYPGESRDVDAILECASSGASSSLSGGIVVINEGPYVRLGPPPEPQDHITAHIGDRFLWEGATYSVRVSDAPHRALPGGRFTVLAAGSLSTPMTVRGVREGDKIDTGEGSTRVSELLRVHGVHRDLRPVSLVVADGGKIAAVIGVRTATWAAPRGGEPIIVIEREVKT
jgi:tRNA(Ile)-lysidine synthase